MPRAVERLHRHAGRVLRRLRAGAPRPAAQSAPELAHNRCVFQMLARAHGVPVPHVYAVLVRDAWGYDSDDDRPVAPGDWVTVLDAVDGRVTLRPVLTDGGRGVTVHRSAGGLWLGAGAAHHTTASLVQALAGTDRVGAWLVERAPGDADAAVLRVRVRTDEAGASTAVDVRRVAGVPAPPGAEDEATRVALAVAAMIVPLRSATVEVVVTEGGAVVTDLYTDTAPRTPA